MATVGHSRLRWLLSVRSGQRDDARWAQFLSVGSIGCVRNVAFVLVTDPWLTQFPRSLDVAVPTVVTLDVAVVLTEQSELRTEFPRRCLPFVLTDEPVLLSTQPTVLAGKLQLFAEQPEHSLRHAELLAHEPLVLAHVADASDQRLQLRQPGLFPDEPLVLADLAELLALVACLLADQSLLLPVEPFVLAHQPIVLPDESVVLANLSELYARHPVLLPVQSELFAHLAPLLARITQLFALVAEVLTHLTQLLSHVTVVHWQPALHAGQPAVRSNQPQLFSHLAQLLALVPAALTR